MKYFAWFRLMRLDKPVGIWLLWFPTAWALCLAAKGQMDWYLAFLFFAGTVLMRSAGCVINDIADRHIDTHVKRTALRPLTSGETGLVSAFILLFILLLLALVVLIQLPRACFYYAVLALLITFIYPFCKRFISGPQLVLGFAFSMGIPMAYAALGLRPDWNTVLLLVINYCWIVAYDTEYALVDRDDDLRIGVKSTAIWFGESNRLMIGLLQIVAHSLWLILAFLNQLSAIFLVYWLLGALIFIYQQRLLSAKSYFSAFLSNSYYGLVMWVGIWHGAALF